MKKLKLLIGIAALLLGGANSVNAETDYTSLMPSDWTINATNPGNFQGGKEAYNTANYKEGEKIIYQSFTAPAAGIYEIKFYAVTSSTSGRGFDNKFGDNIAQAYAAAGSNKSIVAMTVIDQTGCTLAADANIRTLSVEAAEGETIEYGLENIAEGGNWYTIQNISAKMKTVAEIFQAQYDEAYAIWEHSTENEVGAKATFKTYVDAMNTALSGTLAEAQTASDNLAAALITYENKSYPVKGSGVKYDFTSKMNMAINAWTCKQGNGPAQYGFTGATETYGNTNAGEVMYQTISGLANGEYEIHFYAVANAANGGGTAGSGLTYVYANDQKLEIKVISQSSCTPSDYERTLIVMVKDGTIKYGITNTATAGNWYICKNVALYMTGAPDLSDYYDAIAEKLITANALKASVMKATILSTLQDAIDATSGYESITVTSILETLSNNLTTAINDANSSVEKYAAAKTLLEKANILDAAGQASYAANETVAAIQSAYDARTLDEVTAEQISACETAMVVATRAQTTANTNWTAVITNPSFNTGNVTGWTNTGMAIQGNDSFGGKEGSHYAEAWQPNGTKAIKQDINLPMGIYQLSANALARGVTSAKLIAGENETAITVSEEWAAYSVEFAVVEEGNVTIGFEGTGTQANSSWLCVDNFTLIRVSVDAAEVKKAALKNTLATANGLVDKNIGTGVFQIPESANATFKGAISTAQSVYDNSSSTIDNVTSAISDLNNAIKAFQSVELNAPDASKHYNLIVATASHAKNGNAIVIVPGTTGANNPTGYVMNANFAINSNLAQAIAFTAVEGKSNTYNLSFETADGTAYLTYGRQNGSAADWADSQIQATTDASKKGEFLIAATTTDNVFNIYNTNTNSTIACQGSGSLYTEAGNADFSVAEASQATVNVAIVADVKYATRIFPFTPALPSGVKAYSCEAATDATLTLVEVAAPAANVPYILEAAGGCESTDLKGWGIAAAETYTTGWLTGVYTATAAPKDSYVLQNNDGNVAFYLVAEGQEPTVRANRAYLTVPSAARPAFFFGDDNTTGIEAINALTNGTAEIYNVNGVKVPALQKGMNIVKTANGKTQKILVK